jgi:hypothetical protein
MPALAPSHVAPQSSSQFYWREPLPAPRLAIQAVDLAFYQRGPPAA